jgi:predicted PurR-regulated permease PerM
MTNNVFNDRLRQLMLLALIILLGWLLLKELYIFLPGLLGGVTLYILSRSLYFKLTFKRKWKKGWTALLFIIVYLIIIALPVYLCVQLVTPKITELSNNQDKIMNGLRLFSQKITDITGMKLLTPENTRSITQKVSALVPKLLNSTASVITNLIMMFFLLYYLLTCGREVERYLNKVIPLKPDNVDKLAAETKLMIRANALGIPIICIVQGAFAALGYWIFGLDDWAMWGFVTGVFAFFPLVGTMIVWVPLVIFLFSKGENWMATGLSIYSIIVTGNVDYITRLGLLKRMGNVHPMITVIGVIAGLGLFGFMGLIFGPLLVSYFIILMKIYMNEFTASKEAV